MNKQSEAVDISIPMPWGSVAGKTFGEARPIPVLCIHGRSDNLESFSRLLPLLPRNQYYVCIDMPGHGKSTHAHKGYILDYLWYAMVVKRVINHFKWSKVTLMGHSFGAQLSYILAALYPELVVKLVAIDSLLFAIFPPDKTLQCYRKEIFEPLMKFENRSSLDQAPTYTLEEFLKKMKESRNTEVTESEIREMAKRNLVQVGPNQYKHSNDQRVKILYCHQFTDEQLIHWACAIQCPVLVILGMKSLTSRPHKYLSHTPLQKTRNITFKVIEGDHDIQLSRPNEVAHLIAPFLSGECMSKL